MAVRACTRRVRNRTIPITHTVARTRTRTRANSATEDICERNVLAFERSEMVRDRTRVAGAGARENINLFLERKPN